ncbi:MAG: carbon starvation protein A [Pseudomonadota bacterium]
MNALWLCLLALVWFVIGYHLYGRFIERTLVKPDDAHVTPAHAMNDGVDFVVGRRIYLWGNHFASIAGAGPIIGPIVAVSVFGWGPVFAWVLVGALFMGAVHDYLSLMISARHRGAGIAELAESLLGRTVRMVFALLLYIVLVLLIAVFMVSVAQAFINMPALVVPTLGLIGIAVVMGLAMERWHVPEVPAATAAVAAAYFLIWVGYHLPVSLPSFWGDTVVLAAWCLVLTAYCLSASIAPMWLLLRPRDFISSVKLVVGMLLGLAAIAVVQPTMSAPITSGGFVSHGKPLWPILFILVACGAISGFHAIVSTGTTARQLDRESDGRPIAFGGMLTEGLLAVVVIVVVSGGLTWGAAPVGVTGAAANLYFATALKHSWIVAFGSGFGHLVGEMGIPLLTSSLAALLGAVMVKSFILTTLDAGTRLARFLVVETLGEKVPVLRGHLAASLVVVLPALVIAVTNTYHEVWKLFGAANQLIASVALVTISAYLAHDRLPKRYTLIPAVFMLATTVGALLWESFGGATGYLTSATPDWPLGILACVLVVLAAVIVAGGVKALAREGGWKPSFHWKSRTKTAERLGDHRLSM